MDKRGTVQIASYYTHRLSETERCSGRYGNSNKCTRSSKTTLGPLLATLNIVCFVVHLSFFALTLFFVLEGDGVKRDLKAPLVRLRSVWKSNNIDGYIIDVVPSGVFDIGVNTLLWFGLTASFHLAGYCALKYSDTYWRWLDEARPLWCVA